MTYQPQAVGLDIFQGGFSLGVQRAGFNLRCNLEENDFGNKTFKANFPDVPVYIGKDTWPVEQLRREDIDLCYSNPPCVVFSAAALATKANWRNKAELKCTQLCFDTMERIGPAIYVWECVPRAWTMGKELVEEMTDRALKLGYSVTYLFNDSILFNTGQRRRRFMFVAHVVELFPSMPPLPDVMTVDQALRDMEPNHDMSLSPGLANALLHSERTTGSRRDLRAAWDEINVRGQDKGRPKMMDHRIDGHKPCSTITGMISQIHPRELRYIAPNEVARLCGYPDDWKWVYKNPTDFQQQCCKAVLPGAGQFLGEIAYKAIEVGNLTSNQVKIYDPRPWAEWYTDKVIEGLDKPEPAVRYLDYPHQPRLRDAVVYGGANGGGKTTKMKEAVAAAASVGVTVQIQRRDGTVETVAPIIERAAVATPGKHGKPIYVVGHDEKGPIRSRNPLIVDGKVVRRPIGKPMKGS